MARARNRLFVLLLCVLSLVVLGSAPLAGQPSGQQISYQFRVTDAAGNPLDGDHAVVFRVYATVSGGTPLWSETHGAVAIANGIGCAILGATSPLDGVFDGSDRWIGMAMDGGPELERVKVTSAPFALGANRIGGLTLANLDGRFVNAGVGSTETVGVLRTTKITPAEGSTLFEIELAGAARQMWVKFSDRHMQVLSYQDSPIDLLSVSRSGQYEASASLCNGMMALSTRPTAELIQTRGFLYHNGDLTVSGLKSFVQDHPSDPTRCVYYACMEGPESGTYVRGEGQLRNSRAAART